MARGAGLISCGDDARSGRHREARAARERVRARPAARRRGVDPDGPIPTSRCATCATCRGRRSTTTESRDLDQIEVAERLDDGAIRVLVGDRGRRRARAEGLADRPVREANTADALHRRAHLPDAARAAVDRPHVAARRRRSPRGGHRDRRARATARSTTRGPRSTRRASTTRPSWCTSTSAPGSKATASRRAMPAIAAQLRCRTRSRSGCAACATSTARSISRRIEAQAGRARRRGRRPRGAGKNRARKLIEDLMIAANGATARYLEAHGRSSIRRVVVKPKRWDRIVELAASLGTKLPRGAERACARRVPDRAPPRPTRRTSPISRSSVVKLLGPGQYVAAARGRASGSVTSGSPSTTTRTRPRRTAATPISITQRLLKAAAAGGAAAVQRRRARRRSRSTAPSARTPRARSSARCARSPRR